MKIIKINTGEYYNRPEFYPHMPAEIFNALEQSALNDEDQTEVSEEAFEKMINDSEMRK